MHCISWRRRDVCSWDDAAFTRPLLPGGFSASQNPSRKGVEKLDGLHELMLADVARPVFVEEEHGVVDILRPQPGVHPEQRLLELARLDLVRVGGRVGRWIRVDARVGIWIRATGSVSAQGLSRLVWTWPLLL